MTQKQQLDDTEDKYLSMKRELDSKTVQLEKLSFINKDFKEKANIGMLEFLELELKNKENQLASLHARLDEKQKEYVAKLENYQTIFNEQTARLKELEDSNYELRQKTHESKAQSGLRSEDMDKLNQELQALETELLNEKDKSRKLHEDLFREKDRLMHLEIKSSDVERQNVDLQLRINDLESKVEEQEANISKLEVGFAEQGFQQRDGPRRAHEQDLRRAQQCKERLAEGEHRESRGPPQVLGSGCQGIGRRRWSAQARERRAEKKLQGP